MKASKQSAVDLIRRSLEEDIYQGVLPPGAAIDEAALMKKFAVSRTPVRTSLSQLASQGLIEIVPRSGTYVLSMTPRELVCMLEVLGELEGANAKFAARRMTSEARTDLKTFHEKGAEISESGNAESYESYNENLHDLIYDASLNPYLTQQILKIRRRTRVYRRG